MATVPCDSLDGEIDVDATPEACAQSAEAAHYQKMYDRVSALAHIGVWECELATGKLTWTDAVYDLFDIPRGTPVMREQGLDCYEPESRREMEQLRQRAIDTGVGFVLDVAIRTRLGNNRWVRLTVDVEQQNGVSIHIFGTKQDITAERAAQAAVQSLQTELIHVSRVSAMNAMSSTLAHEVNQPLAAISNYMAAAARIAKRSSVPDELTQCIEAARDAAGRAGEIVRRLREINARGLPEKAVFRLQEVVKEAVSLVLADRPKVSVTYRVAPDASVEADRIQIQQVLINLLQNAVESAADGACAIDVASSQTATHLEICISDNGTGIPVHLLPAIFEAFVTTKAHGPGVGLSICRTIIEAHGGCIVAANRPEGGASFSFTLPLSPE